MPFVYAGLELRPLPSTGITRRPRYYEPLRHPIRPGLSLAGVRLEVTRLRQVGLPVLQVSVGKVLDVNSAIPERGR